MNVKISWLAIPLVLGTIWFRSGDDAPAFKPVDAARGLPGATQTLPVYLPSKVTFRQDWNQFGFDAQGAMKPLAVGYRWVVKPATWDRGAIERFYDQQFPASSKSTVINADEFSYKVDLNGMKVEVVVDGDDQQIEVMEQRPAD